MTNLLSLKINGTQISAPAGIPTGGLSDKGSGVINLVIQFIFVGAIALTIIFIMLSGIEWITSGGDEKKIEKAKGRLTYSIIGLVVIFASFFIVKSVFSLLGGSPLYFLNTRTSQEACPMAASYVDCGAGRYICGTTDKSACNAPAITSTP